MTEGIFNSPELLELVQRYERGIFDLCPLIVTLSQADDLSGERLYIEDLVASVPEQKQKKWIGEFIRQKDEQHLSAWFEIMLYGWLKQSGSVEVEPEIFGEFPDFAFRTENSSLPTIIEARAVLKSENDRRTNEARRRVITLLEQIHLPFLVTIEGMHISSLNFLKNLSQETQHWLQETPDENLSFQDEDNIIVMSSKPLEGSRVSVLPKFPSGWGDPDYLKLALKQKAKQHKKIRKAGYPYVIALFIEDDFYSISEVFNTWIGNTVFTISLPSGKTIDTRNDCLGLSFHNGRLQNKSISGILVFHQSKYGKEKTRKIKGLYLQNPYANIQVDWKTFPVEAACVPKGHDGKNYFMGWENNAPVLE